MPYLYIDGYRENKLRDLIEEYRNLDGVHLESKLADAMYKILNAVDDMLSEERERGYDDGYIADD